MFHSPSVLVERIPYARCLQCQTFVTFSFVVLIEGRQERSSSSTDIHPFLKRLGKPFVGLRLAYWIITKCFFKHSVCFRSRLAEFEAEFDANPLFLRISHLNRSVRSQNSTNMTSQNAQTKNTPPNSGTSLGRVVHKGYSSRYLTAHNCTIGSFRAALQIQGLLSSTSYATMMGTLFFYKKCMSKNHLSKFCWSLSLVIFV